MVNKFLVSKGTVVLRRWERSKQKFGFIKRVDKERQSEGLTLETSAFQIFHGGNFTFINSFDKTKFLFLYYYIIALSSLSQPETHPTYNEMKEGIDDQHTSLTPHGVQVTLGFTQMVTH